MFLTHTIHCLLRMLAKLPLSWLRQLASGLGWLIYLGSAHTRRTIASNLAQANLTLSVRQVLQQIARGGADMIWVWFNSPQAVVAKMTVAPEARQAVTDALSKQEATILLTPHLGCFEALAKWIAWQTPLTAMYRRPRQAWAAQLVEAARQMPQLTMARADGSGVRLALKTLKSGGLLGILPDQVPQHGEGVWLPWFGRLAYTITLPAKLQLATQARVYIVSAVPYEGGWQVQCQLAALPASPDSIELTTVLNTALEVAVRNNPWHYGWSYTRYKGVAVVS